MSMKKKALAAASYVMVAALAIGGTVAYLTDRDNATNTFTMGNVDIELNEDFEQGSELVPGVNITKKPTITNVGKSDAWVWMTFSIPTALDNFVQGTEQGSNENVIHWNPTASTTVGYVSAENVEAALKAGILPAGTTYEDIVNEKCTWEVFNSHGEGLNAYQEKIDGETYNTYVFMYNGTLEPGETTLPSVYKVFLDAAVDIDPDGNMYKVVDGKAKDLKWNVEKDGAPKIYVNAYAIQADGFADVKTAYNAYVGQWGELNGEHEDVTVIEEAENLNAALAAGGNVVMAVDVTSDENVVQKGGTLNGGGNTLTKTGTVYDGTTALNAGVLTTGGTVEDMVIVDETNKEVETGKAVKGFRAIYVNGMTEDMYVKNCVLNGTYAINVNANAPDYMLHVSDSTLNGWTSFGRIKGAEFTNCKFGEGTGYKFMRPHADATYTNCDFVEGYEIDIENGTGAKLTFVNCRLNGVLLTADNIADLMEDDAEVANVTVK